MRKSGIFVRTLALLCVLVFLLSATGCGGDIDAGTTTPDVTTDSTDEQAKELTIIKNGILSPSNSIINPSNISSIGDPYILYDDGMYYLYCTSEGIGYKVWKSPNMRYWEYVGYALNKTSGSWGVKNYWAPEVYKHNGKYYMVYSAQNSANIHSLGAAVSDSPTGPFVNLTSQPMLAFDYSVIDAHVYFAEDGRLYLYYAKDCSTNIVNGIKESHIYGVELSDDFKSVIGKPKLLLTPSQGWEFGPNDKVRWNEGPYVFENNGTFYMMYSANLYSTAKYAVGYATSDNPLGPFIKYQNNPILQGDGVTTSGSGHNSLTVSPDGSEIWTAYHTHTFVTNPSGNRQVCVDRLVIREDGTLYINGPSLTNQPQPSGYKGFVNVSRKATADREDSKVLFDNIYWGKGVQNYDLSPENEILLSFEEEVNLVQVWIYPGNNAAAAPKSFDMIINDTYKIEGVRFVQKEGEPAVAVISSLPEGELTHNIRLSFTAADNADIVSISEIIIIAQQ